MEQNRYLSAPTLSSYSSTEVASMINKQLARVTCFINSILNIMMMIKVYWKKKSFIPSTRNLTDK